MLVSFSVVTCAALVYAPQAHASLRFELSDQFGPKVLQGELIGVLYQKDIDNDGVIEIILSTSDGSGTSGSVYVYSPDGTLEWRKTFEGSGVDYVSIHDFDKDGTDEILVRLNASKTFHVISHTGSEEWNGTVADNIVWANYYHDLNNDGVDDIIVFSRDTTIPRGQITVFDFASHSVLGVREYTAADLSGTGSPYNATVRDLNGDGVKEIIPSPRYLSKKFEILDSTAAVRVVKTFSYDVKSCRVADLNLDGKDDIIVEIMDDNYNSGLHAYMNYDGNDFTSSWTYPHMGTMKKIEYLNVSDGKIAFGTVNYHTYSGCKVYLLNAATGGEVVSPIDVKGLVDDLEFKDLNGDGMRELAVLTKEFAEATSSVEITPRAEIGKSENELSRSVPAKELHPGTSTWTIKTYDQNLNLLAPSGHHTYSLNGRLTYYDQIRATDLSNDGLLEIIPKDRTGNNLYVARYDGVLKWQYTLDEELDTLGSWDDLNNDGKKDLVVGTENESETSGHVYTFADGENSGILLGSKAFPDGIHYVDAHDFDKDGYYEIITELEHGTANSYVYSYDFTGEILNNPISGTEIQDIDYTCDMDANGVDDLFFATNDTVSNTGYLYLYRGVTSQIDVRMNGDTFRSGNALIVDVTVPPISQRFNAWGVIRGPGINYSMVLGKPHELRRGLKPLITGVPGLTKTYTGRLLEISSIPPNVPAGTYTITIGLVSYGVTPKGPESAISGYVFQKEVYINSSNSPGSDIDEPSETTEEE